MSQELEEREAYLVPVLGTVVGLQAPEEVAQALSDVRRLESDIREAKRILSAALVEESKRRGSKTLALGSVEVEIRGGKEVLWDTEALQRGLQAAGCPDTVINEIIKTEVTFKVDARRAQRASNSNPAYAQVIDAARSEHEKPHTVVLRESRG